MFFMVSPAAGTTFDMKPMTGGKIRRPSFITACRYGRFLASESVIGEERVEEVISVRSFWRTAGDVMMERSVARMAVAEVSEPATIWRRVSVWASLYVRP